MIKRFSSNRTQRKTSAGVQGGSSSQVKKTWNYVRKGTAKNARTKREPSKNIYSIAQKILALKEQLHETIVGIENNQRFLQSLDGTKFHEKSVPVKTIQTSRAQWFYWKGKELKLKARLGYWRSKGTNCLNPKNNLVVNYFYA